MASRPPRNRPLPLLVLVLLAVAPMTGTLAQWKFEAYPDYLDVQERLYSTHEVVRDGCFPKLAKKPDGWWLVFEGNDSVQTEHQLWSYATKEYVKVDLPKLRRGEEPTPKEKFADTDWTAAYYRVCPYFGYRGWFADVIKEYGTASGLPDHIQYGVARAYSGAARSRLDDLQAEADKGYTFLTEPGDTLTDVELAEYKDLWSKGCDWFNRIAVHDPGFETHVGEITLKRDNEYVTGYMDLLMVEGEAAAGELLPPGLYEPFYRSVAKNYLASCDSNAILFTNGDNDTYPLWYMQAVEGYRRDVLVLNLSLLNAPRYIEAMRHGYHGSEPVDWLLSDAFYRNDLSTFARIGDDKDTLDLTTVIELLRTVDARLGKQKGRREDLNLSTGRFRIEGPNGSRIAWKFPKTFALRNVLAVLDILAQHAKDRPIHWAVTTGPDSYFGLTRHLALQGLTYKLVFDKDKPEVLSGAYGLPQRVIGERSTELFLKEFDWSLGTGTTSNKVRMVNNYILQMCNTAEQQVSDGDTIRARALLDRAVSVFPNEPWSFERVMLPLIELLWKIGDGDKADSLARILVHNLKTLPHVVAPVDNASDEDQEREIREAVIDRLRTTAEQHKRSEFLAFIDALPSAWPSPLVVKKEWPGSTRGSRRK